MKNMLFKIKDKINDKNLFSKIIKINERKNQF